MSDLCHSDVCSPIILQKQEVGERTSSDLLHLDVICTSAFCRVGNLLNSYLQTNDFHAICHGNRITEFLPVLPPLQVTIQDKKMNQYENILLYLSRRLDLIRVFPALFRLHLLYWKPRTYLSKWWKTRIPDRENDDRSGVCGHLFGARDSCFFADKTFNDSFTPASQDIFSRIDCFLD